MVQESFIISTKNGDEYRVKFIPAGVENLSKTVQDTLSVCGVDVSELIIDRVKGNSSTDKSILNSIVRWIAGVFAEHPEIIIYYSCDDCNQIPARNHKGANRDITVQEYRSRLFTHMFDTYMVSHCVSGITNTPICIEGEGYNFIMHIIARDEHLRIVEIIKNDIKEGYGKPDY